MPSSRRPTRKGIFLDRTDERIRKLGNLISLGHRELIYTFLGKGYVDAVAAHEESIVQYMKDYDTSFRVLEEPLMIAGIRSCFCKKRITGGFVSRWIRPWKKCGWTVPPLRIMEKKYLDDPEKYSGGG